MRFLLDLKLFKALSHRPVLILWSGQAFSAIGDEVYKVAIVWLAVGMVGEDAGYIAAGQCGAVLLFGLFGGIWADHWDPWRTMVSVDLIRGFLVLVPVAWFWFLPLNLPVLIFVALSVSAMSAFFDPAIQSSIPRLARGRELVQATNGLMGTTPRLARVVGPSLVGSLTGLIPTIHFFTLDALSFGVSAYALSKLRSELPHDSAGLRPRQGISKSLKGGMELIRGDALMQFIVWSKAVVSGSWSVIFPLGIALMIQKMLPGDVRAFGFLLAAYGVGNLGGTLVLANVSMVRPLRVMCLGFLALGVGFILMAAVPSFPVMMFGAAFAAIGGPMNDLAHIALVQARYEREELVRIVRFKMAIEFGGMMACLAISPMLFKLLSPRAVVAVASLAILVVGALGFYRFRDTAHGVEAREG